MHKLQGWGGEEEVGWQGGGGRAQDNCGITCLGRHSQTFQMWLKQLSLGLGTNIPPGQINRKALEDLTFLGNV